MPRSANRSALAVIKLSDFIAASIASSSDTCAVAMLSTISLEIYLNAAPARAPYAAVLTDLPTALESFSPCNKSFVERKIKPAAAPPNGPPANAAIVVSIPTAKLALPGFALAQSLIFLTPALILLSPSPIFFLSSSNLASAFLIGPACCASLPSSLIFASTFLARSTGNLAAAPTAEPALPSAVLLSPLAIAVSSAPLKIDCI